MRRGIMCGRREAIVTGRAEPTEAELEGFEAPDAADPRLQHSGAKVAQGVPGFWLTVLCNQVSWQGLSYSHTVSKAVFAISAGKRLPGFYTCDSPSETTPGRWFGQDTEYVASTRRPAS